MSNPSLGWQKLQDVFYRLRTCYNYSTTNRIDTSRNVIRLSTNCTIFAILPKVAFLNGSNSYTVKYYSSSGNHITSINHNLSNGAIINLEFHNEDLILILNNNKFKYFNDLNGNFNEYDFTSNLIHLSGIADLVDTSDENGVLSEEFSRVLKSKVYRDLLVLQLKSKFIIVNLNTFKNYEIPLLLTPNDSVSDWEILMTSSTSFQIIMSVNKTIQVIDIDLVYQRFSIEDKYLTEGPFKHISTAPNNDLIALFNEDNKLFIVSKHFDRNLLEFDNSDSDAPHQVAWCGNDAVVTSYEDELKLVGPSGASISFYYDDINDINTTVAPIISTCVDGLKILSNDKLEFLSRVSDVTVDVFKIGSTSPSAILLDSIDKLQQHSPKADSNLSLLISNDSLLEAVMGCLIASTEEFDPHWSKKLIKASSYGKSSIELFNSDEYVEVINQLRILHQLRSEELGIFLTYNQFIDIGMENIINMLLIRNLHYLAIKLSDFVKLDNLKVQIYIHWCCYKIKNQLNATDKELYDVIIKKLTSFSDTPAHLDKNPHNLISIEKISSVAYQEGRLNLCKLLINDEPNLIKKINLYLNLEEDELALVKSFNYADSDLCKLILLMLQSKLSISHFFKILNQNEKNEFLDFDKNEFLPISGELIENFWVQNIGKSNTMLLNKFLTQEDRSIDIITKDFLKFIKDDSNLNDSYYDEYNLHLEKLINNYNHGLHIAQDLKIFNDELKLLNLKKSLSSTYSQNFFKLNSIVDVIGKLISMNQLSKTHKLAKEYKLNDSKYWYLILNTFSELSQYDKLYDFVSANKSPFGYLPFVQKCLNKGESRYASMFIAMCTNLDYTERIELFIKNKDYKSAATEAFRNKDVNYLDAIHNGGDSEVKALIRGYKERLGRR